jgi:hypothetical protein
MDPTKLLSYAQKAVGDKAWTVELVLRIGAELAGAVNSFPNLSGADKAELVCQTILKMLDDAEKAERGRSVESTEKEKTIALLEQCRAAVKTVLPVSLELMVAVSRGKIVLKKILSVGCKPQEICSWLPSLKWPSWHWLPSLDPCGSVIQETNKVADLIAQTAASHLEEMRGLVAKAEALLASAKAEAKAKVTVVSAFEEVSGTGLKLAQLPPTPEFPVLTLPGESASPSELAAPPS